MALVTGLFAVALGLWWGRVAWSAALAWGWPLPGAAALVVAVLAVLAGRALLRPVAGPARAASRGFLALGLSFGLGALPLALAAMDRGAQTGARVAAEGANPLSAILSVPLAPILAGNLMAGLELALAAGGGALCLVLAAVFGIERRRR